METKFKSKPAELRALPNPEDVARFAAGAETRAVDTSAIVSKEPASPNTRRWDQYDKNAKALSGINLRLNDYERELLRVLAEADQRSIQQTIKRLLIPAAEAAAKLINK